MQRIGNLDIDEVALQKALQSNAEGNGYDGSSDTLLDFGNASSFGKEYLTGKKFKLRIENKSNGDVKINMNPAVHAEGHQSLKEGTVIEGVTAKGDQNSIDVLLAYFKANPTRIYDIRITVDDTDQLDESIKLRKITPWTNYIEEQRTPIDYQSDQTTNKNFSHINDVQHWLFSSMDTLLYTIRKGRTVTLTFLFGASLDTAKGLEKSALLANQNIAIAVARG